MPTPPQGYAQGRYAWPREHREALFAMFINAADEHGACIAGIPAGAVIEMSSASGIASFSEDKGNTMALSIIGLVAAGAEVAAAIRLPEAQPLVDAGEEFARQFFVPGNVHNKRRDAYGVDPASGHKARQEGGILFSLPEAGGPVYSGNDDHRERWIKEPGDRTEANHPPQLRAGHFFPIQGNDAHNTRRAAESGETFVTPWDHKFGDNAGYYRVFVHIHY